MMPARSKEIDATMKETREARFNPLSKLDIGDQDDRLQEVQSLLYNARTVAEGVYYERIDPKEAHAVMFFLAHTLEHAADVLAEDMVQFGMVHNSLAAEGDLKLKHDPKKGNVV